MMFLRYSLWVALGGALGAVFRFWVAECVHVFFERGFPYGTLFVNVLGSFLMGFLSFYLFHRFSFSAVTRSFLLIGLLGAFTTFSTFSLDTVNLFISGRLGLGLLYVGLSVLLCVFFAGLGMWLGEVI